MQAIQLAKYLFHHKLLKMKILLSAKIWKIKFVDHKAKKIEVIPAKDGKKPMFFGGGATVHQK
jgi:hypothetical protein